MMDAVSSRTSLCSPARAILLATSVFYHAKMGLQTVIEDYQHDETRVVALIALNLVYGASWLLAAFSILRIAFTGTPA